MGTPARTPTTRSICTMVLRAAGVLLVAAAILKSVDLEQTSAWLDLGFGMPTATPLLVVVIIGVELILGMASVLWPTASAAGVLVLFSLFLGWHIAEMMGVKPRCPCLGPMLAFLPPTMASVTMTLVSLMMIISSSQSLFQGELR